MTTTRGTGRRRRGREVDGILLLDKPCGISSNQALQRAKRIFDARKAGHTGTLDVEAEGLLPVCFGEATKVCQFLLDADKRYLSEFTLGVRTTSGDREGEVVNTRPTTGIDRAAVEQAASGFLGAIEQLPPMHSALKQNGQPLYKLAHQGIEVERQVRTVHIHALTVRTFVNPRLEVDVACSKGTYIRTLAEDLGEALGCGAYVSALRRCGVGSYDADDALTLPRLEALAARGQDALDEVLLPPDSALDFMPWVALGDDAAYFVSRGQPVFVPKAPTSGLLRLYDAYERFIGVGEIADDGRVAPRRLFRSQPPESEGETAPRGT